MTDQEIKDAEWKICEKCALPKINCICIGKPVFFTKEDLERAWHEAAKEYCSARNAFNLALDRKMKAKYEILRSQKAYYSFVYDQHGLKEGDIDDE